MTAIDMRQMCWGDSSKSGPWIKFALPDSETLEPLKLNDGKCFKVFLVPVDENGNPLQGEKADISEQDSDDAELEPLKIGEFRASNFAAMMTYQENYWQFIGALNQKEADIVLKESNGVASKKEFDWDADAHSRLKAHVDKYVKWTNMRGEFMEDVTRDHAINYLGGSIDDEDGLSLANV
jgi:hypothetical protein